jgi:hypothetical protein
VRRADDATPDGPPALEHAAAHVGRQDDVDIINGTPTGTSRDQAVDAVGALADDLEPADEELEEADDTRDPPIPVPEPAAVPSSSTATATDPTTSPTPPPPVVPLPGTPPAVAWRRSLYWPGPPRCDRNDC